MIYFSMENPKVRNFFGKIFLSRIFSERKKIFEGFLYGWTIQNFDLWHFSNSDYFYLIFDNHSPIIWMIAWILKTKKEGWKIILFSRMQIHFLKISWYKVRSLLAYQLSNIQILYNGQWILRHFDPNNERLDNSIF